MNQIDPKRIMSGEWSFKRYVQEEDLVQVARQWSTCTDGSNFCLLQVRGCSNDEFCIGFIYVMPDGDKKTYDECFHKMRQKLADRFGVGLKGWSLCTPTQIIKLVSLPDQ